VLAKALALRASASIPDSWILGRVETYLARFRLIDPERLALVLGPSETAALHDAERAMDSLSARRNTNSRFATFAETPQSGDSRSSGA
jgi:hypothetical protein